MYRIFSYTFLRNYSFLNAEIQRSQYIRQKVTVHKCSETIQRRKLFKDGNYMRKYGKYILLFKKTTLQFVSGFYIFIRCHELSFENSLTALWLFMSTLHTVQAVVVSLMHSPMKNFCINNFVCKTLSCLCKMQLCSDFEYHNKTSFPNRNKKYCLKKKIKLKTSFLKLCRKTFNNLIQ